MIMGERLHTPKSDSEFTPEQMYLEDYLEVRDT